MKTNRGKLAIAGLLGLAGLLTSGRITGLGSGRDIHISSYAKASPIQEQTTERKNNVREAPTYSEDERTGVPANYCSRYVRLAAHDMFNIEYPRADIWNLGKFSQIRTIKLSGSNELQNLVQQGVVHPGDIIGVYNPASTYNKTNKAAIEAGYTHAIMLTGEEEGNLYFAEQRGHQINTKIDLPKIEKAGLRPVVVLQLKNRK